MGSVQSSQIEGNEETSEKETGTKNPKVKECKEFLEKPKVETAKVKTEEEVPGFLSFFGNWDTFNNTHEPTEEEKKTDECEKIIATAVDEKVETQNQSNGQNDASVGVIGNENNDHGLNNIDVETNEQEGEGNNIASNVTEPGENDRTLANFEANSPQPNIFEPTPTMPKSPKVGGRRTRKNKPRRQTTPKNAEIQTSV